MKIQTKALLYFVVSSSTCLFVQSNEQKMQSEPELHKHQSASHTNGKLLSIPSSLNGFLRKLSPYKIHRRMSSNEGNIRWEPLGDFITGDAEYDQFGVSVAMSDDGRIIASGGKWNDKGGTKAGHVKVYQYGSGADGEWKQIGDDIVGKTALEWFGYRLDISGDGSRIVIGGHSAENAAGVVRVYENQGGNWTQVGDDLIGDTYWDSFGRDVSISNDGATIAVGANLDEETNSILNTGSLRVYHEDSGSWSQVGSKLVGKSGNDKFGYSVSLSGDALSVAVGAPSEKRTAGYAQLYKLEEITSNETDWIQFGYDVDGHPDGDYFGSRVTLSGDGQYIGVSGFDDRYVKVYKVSGNRLVKVGNDFSVEDSGSLAAISFSYDGGRLIIGDQKNDEFGQNAGRAQVFELVGDEWVQLGSDLYSLDDAGVSGTLAEYHYFGSSVAMSRDGSTVAIGARTGDLNGKDNSGHVRVFRMVESESLSPRQSSNILAIALPIGVIVTVFNICVFGGKKRRIFCCNKGSGSKGQNELPVGSPVVDGKVEII